MMGPKLILWIGLSMKKKELPFIESMFDRIAPRYDFLNHFLSLHQDKLWRKKAVSSLKLPQNGRVLDVACGTADIAMEVIRRHPDAFVTGLDFSEGMLAKGLLKIQNAGMEKAIKLKKGNALALPFEAESFDALTIAFGIRNIQDREGALLEFFRCLKPGGRLAVLELATPKKGFLRSLYLLYFNKILPRVAGLFSSNTAYQYLPDSVLAFPEASEFAEQIRNAGFKDVAFKKLTLGVATLFMAEK